jgi:hypothetical protein
MEIIEVSGLVIAIAALLVAVFGIRDVRKQVELLLTMERNRTFTKLLHRHTLAFVDITDEDVRPDIVQLQHEYVLLARAVDKNATLESSMNEINKEVLSNAGMLVKAGHAQWKEKLDLETVAEILRDWQAEKFVGTMFRNKPRSE